MYIILVSWVAQWVKQLARNKERSLVEARPIDKPIDYCIAKSNDMK